MDTSPEFLSRFQFGFTAAYHIMFPALSVGLAWFLVVVHALYLRSRKPVYYLIYKFWSGIFALNFAMGVVTGIFMSFQFGLNWSGYAYAVGPVLGTIIGLEVVTAFFLEAGFLGIMLLGWDRVPPRIHFLATFLVALGTLISATWILGANSWMHTPAGFAVHNGQFVITDWWRAVLNPSFFYRYPHMLLASAIATSFFVAGISAWYLLRGRAEAFARTSFSLALGVGTVAIVAQVWLGDVLAGKMATFQPAKMQALEGNWADQPTAPWLVLIVPDQAHQRNRWQWGIPGMGSLFLTHSRHGVVPGLRRTPPALQPNMGMTFYFFRLMFLLGTLLFVVAVIGAVLRFTGRLYSQRWFLRLCVWLTPAGVIATFAGWITSEAGRQPYVVFGQLLTRDAVSPLSSGEVLLSLGLILSVYLTLLGAYIVFIVRTVRRGPDQPVQALRASGFDRRQFLPNPTAEHVVAHAEQAAASPYPPR